MIMRIGQYFRGRNRALKSALGVTLTVVTLGLLLASDLDQGIPVSVQEESAVKAPSTAIRLSDETISIADLAEKLAPTVVNIRVTKVERTAMPGFPTPEGPYGDFFERYFGQMPDQRQPRKSEGAGSGVVISKDGYLLTNHHVIAGATEVTVTFADEEEYQAAIVGSDPKTDLAILKVDREKPFQSAVLGDSDQLRVGEPVIAIGNPFGLSHTVTSGIVSAKGRVIGAGPYDDFIQTDASINPGNSGGPLFNSRGEVIGINTAIIPNGQGIGFAVPVNTAKPLVPQLIDHGKVTRGYLGVTIQPITRDLARAMELENTHGALVAEVVPGSPADAGDLQAGDVIESFNGIPVKESHDLPLLVAGSPVGRDAEIVIRRDGRAKTLTARIAELDSESNNPAHAAPDKRTEWGLQLQELTPQAALKLGIKGDKGVLVADVKPDSPADRAGLRQGDVILAVNRVSVVSVGETVSAIRANSKDTLLLTVKRGESQLFVALSMNENS
jgi:serine protease Do